jgi:dipeptidase D
MKQDLSSLYPSKLWDIFAGICAIPHPSKHEEKILVWLKEWAEKNNVEYTQDETGNFIFRKPATPGYENCVPVIMQGHIDMVPQANADTPHDFYNDPIIPIIGEDGWLRAKGTTLGADNGIGVSVGMAIMISKDLEHGPLEVLVTVDEETGMTGAFGLKPGALKGEILLNLDTEDEGELYVGCAGGLDATFEFNYNLVDTPSNMKGFEFALTGLRGGHSGMDINLGRANANKVLARFFKKAIENYGVRIANISAGSLRNAIPREAFVTFAIAENKVAEFEQYATRFTSIITSEFAVTEPNMAILITPIETPKEVMGTICQKNTLNMILAIPNGAMRMSDSMPGLVETSTNLATVKTIDGKVIMGNLLRSSVDSAKEALGEKMVAIGELLGVSVELANGYSGWKPNMDSPILKTMQEVYKNKFGVTPKINAIHAGLECGLFSQVYPNWDMISCGPTIRHPHSPDEKVNIESVGKFWDFIVETLKHIPRK